MPNLNELRARLAAKRDEGRKILKLAADEGRGLTEAEETAAAGIKAEVEGLEEQVKAEEGRLERVRSLAASFGDDPAPARIPARTFNEPNPATTGGFKGLAEFATAVRRAIPGGGNVAEVDARLRGALPANTHQESGSTDGYMVPAEYRDQIWNAVDEMGDLYQRMTVEPTASNAVNIGTDETTPWGASGVQAYWRAEAAQMTASKLATKEVQVPLHSLYAFSTATDEIIEDAPRLENQLTMKAAQAIGWKLSDACAYGDGVGKPLGWMNSGALVTVAKESGQAAATIVSANPLKMFARFKPGPGSFWYANPDTLPQLATITVGDQPAFIANTAGLRDAPPAVLLGLPVIWSEHGKTLGTVGDLVLVNPNGYAAFRKAAGTRLDRSIHLYFDYGAEAFRWTVRSGGRPYLSAPIAAANGSSTKSHFVALATRS